MFCPKCGYQLKEGVKFCSNCGNITSNPIAKQLQPDVAKQVDISTEKIMGQPKQSKHDVIYTLLPIFSLILSLALASTYYLYQNSVSKQVNNDRQLAESYILAGNFEDGIELIKTGLEKRPDDTALNIDYEYIKVVEYALSVYDNIDELLSNAQYPKAFSVLEDFSMSYKGNGAFFEALKKRNEQTYNKILSAQVLSEINDKNTINDMKNLLIRLANSSLDTKQELGKLVCDRVVEISYDITTNYLGLKNYCYAKNEIIWTNFLLNPDMDNETAYKLAGQLLDVLDYIDLDNDRNNKLQKKVNDLFSIYGIEDEDEYIINDKFITLIKSIEIDDDNLFEFLKPIDTDLQKLNNMMKTINDKELEYILAEEKRLSIAEDYYYEEWDVCDYYGIEFFDIKYEFYYGELYVSGKIKNIATRPIDVYEIEFELKNSYGNVYGYGTIDIYEALDPKQVIEFSEVFDVTIYSGKIDQWEYYGDPEWNKGIYTYDIDDLIYELGLDVILDLLSE